MSRIVHIINLVRPFTLGQLKELLGRTGTLVDSGFWINNIKSHCYATVRGDWLSDTDGTAMKRLGGDWLSDTDGTARKRLGGDWWSDTDGTARKR